MKQQALFLVGAAALAVTSLFMVGNALRTPQTVAASAECCTTSQDCSGTLTCWDPGLGERACSPDKTGYCQKGLPPE